ncbi:hypothetical protein [Agriterribacter sp.]|uniref:hypothetical protein n=1 Tax=Agriterribacter sp. TaxID=2821509 RepID=UPI002B889E6D|nr:hypothetical protein [Agriterribacter sp.]HRO47966.1 hypothetical protein [Agriterribacter sp.]HRQ15950.1 hypothetical protein [Agriterribacter sp.]
MYKFLFCDRMAGNFENVKMWEWGSKARQIQRCNCGAEKLHSVTEKGRAGTENENLHQKTGGGIFLIGPARNRQASKDWTLGSTINNQFNFVVQGCGFQVNDIGSESGWFFWLRTLDFDKIIRFRETGFSLDNGLLASLWILG